MLAFVSPLPIVLGLLSATEVVKFELALAAGATVVVAAVLGELVPVEAFAAVGREPFVAAANTELAAGKLSLGLFAAALVVRRILELAVLWLNRAGFGTC